MRPQCDLKATYKPAAWKEVATFKIAFSPAGVPFTLLSGGQSGVRAEAKAEQAEAPDFKEVYDLIRTHLAGISEGQMNQAAVSALVSGLSPRVSLVAKTAGPGTAGETPLVSKSNVFDGDILYVRV